MRADFENCFCWVLWDNSAKVPIVVNVNIHFKITSDKNVCALTVNPTTAVFLPQNRPRLI